MFWFSSSTNETSTTKINAILKTDWRSTDRIGLRTDPTAQSISRFPLITERKPLVKRIGVTRPREVGVRTWLVRATIQFYSQVFSFLRSLLSVSKFDFFYFWMDLISPFSSFFLTRILTRAILLFVFHFLTRNSAQLPRSMLMVAYNKSIRQ